MGSFSDTPALIAGGTIAPFRFVKVSTAADDTGLQAAEATTTILGVSDGSTNGPTSANHPASRVATRSRSSIMSCSFPGHRPRIP